MEERSGRQKARKTPHRLRCRRFKKWREKNERKRNKCCKSNNSPWADWCSVSLWKTATSKKFHPVLLLNMMLHGMEYHFHHFGSSVSLASPHNLLPMPSVLTGAAEWETEKTLMLCKHCSAVAKTLVGYQYCFGYKSKTQHQITSIPAKPSTYLLLLN